MKVLQVNLGRGRAAHDVLYATVCEKDIDIVLISEPNVKISLYHNYFNSKSPMWGSPITDARGELLVEWAAELGLNALNLGDEPTFERGNSKSHIDITWASEAMTRHIHEWNVLSGEVFTYHNYIYFEVQQGNGSRGKSQQSQRIFRFLDKDLFATKVKQHFSHSRVHTSPSSSWNRIIAAMISKKIPIYLVNTIVDYFNERKVILGKSKLDVGAGVPQGSTW
ncbi:Endonuclease-reverse transcriptase [Popillia japonica]|uniref:Endonuclease-reverse transcriptase n=1 Tax=Popillia japonica TaxID=7064 RepID=A0AAW1MEI0_POPJA